MKNLFLTALVSFTLAISAFASDEKKVSISVRNSFYSEFKNVTSVDWTVRPNFVKATFINDGEEAEVFYDYDGKKIGSSKTLNYEDLPLKARRNLESRFANYSFTEVIEFYNDDEESYYVSAENDKELLVLKLSDRGSISVFSKTKKKQP